MRSRGKLARAERRLFRQLRKEMSAASDYGAPRTTSRHKAKDVLGAIVTLALVGAFVLQLTDGLASRCRPGLGRGAPQSCSGIAAIAEHSQGAVTLSVCLAAAMAVIAFIWYMIWGYKTKAKSHEPAPRVGD
jgi:hypothetical protein